MAKKGEPAVRVIESGKSVEAFSFGWRTGHGLKEIDPQAAAAELDSIHKRAGGLTPSAVVDAARDDAAVLHPAFEWDDSVAAEQHRESQARLIMRQLVVVYRKPNGELTPPQRYVVKVRRDADDLPIDDETEELLEPRRYAPLRRVMSDAELRRRYVRQAYLDLLSWRRRYKDISEFSAIFEQIDAMNEQLEVAV